MTAVALKPSMLRDTIVGRKLVSVHQEDKRSIVLHFDEGEDLWVHDRLGAHIGYLGYLDQAVDSVEHIGHGTFIRGVDGSDLVRFVTVGWSA